MTLQELLVDEITLSTPEKVKNGAKKIDNEAVPPKSDQKRQK